MLPSVTDPLGSMVSNCGCNIQRPITSRITGSSRFSATAPNHALPNGLARGGGTSKLWLVNPLHPRQYPCCRAECRRSTIGRPYCIHVTESRSPSPIAFRSAQRRLALVGDPTSVPSPPMRSGKGDAHAPAPPPCRRCSPSPMPPAASTAMAIGIMISAVEVLEITHRQQGRRRHEGKQQTPARYARTAQNIASATRRCMPVRSIVSARNAPPRIRNRIGE
jgi:hypothetical protein